MMVLVHTLVTVLVHKLALLLDLGLGVVGVRPEKVYCRCSLMVLVSVSQDKWVFLF